MKALDIPTDLLRTLVTVIDCQSYTRAAEILGCSQPTVSLHMRRLQDHADGELVLPKRKPVELTALGTQLASYARRILALHGDCLICLRRTQVPRPSGWAYRRITPPMHCSPAS